MKKNTLRKPPKKNTSINKKTYPFKLFALSNILVFTTVLILGLSSFIYFQNNDTKKEIHSSIPLQKKKEIKKVEDKYEQNTITFEEKTKALEIEYTNNIDNEVYIEKQKKIKQTFIFKEEIEEPIKYPITDTQIDKQIREIEQTIKKEKIAEEIVKEKKEDTQPVITKKAYKDFDLPNNLPKLAIIIDDMISNKQIKKALDLDYNINMAFLPPTSRHKSSAKITNKLDTYMIHLPLQARTSNYEEDNTLYISDTVETIEQRIKTLRKLYPKTKYINNHTGSKFTSNKQAMDKLFQVLKKYNYTFIDSRTTAKSVAKDSAKKYGVRLLSRNVFLDNKKDAAYIQKQLKKAIKSAKKNGSAIAIGHPHNITFKTLQESKHLLEGLELVFVHQL